MAQKQRVNPHQRGSAEHTLFDSYLRALNEATWLQADADRKIVQAGAHRAKAQHYAAALDALGHPVEGAPKLIDGGTR